MDFLFDFLSDKEACLFASYSALLSIVAFVLTYRAIPSVSATFVEAGLFGRDLCKKDRTVKVPESIGLVSGTVFLMVMTVFLGLRFGRNFINNEVPFAHRVFSENLASLLCICCMLLLGFADDVLNLKWRYKLILPTIASIPLLIVYYVNFRSTTVLIPNFNVLRMIFGSSPNIGPLYYVYISLLAVFCTNAINIYAGINGLESGQALVMAISVALFNLIELNGYQRDGHLFSLCIILPFAATTAALYCYNRYPARVFVGDTFTYFAGMTFAVVGIVGHFSKSVLLFFIPQIFNFLYSTPQIFKLVPCPRHRLPRYNPATDLLEASETKFKPESINKYLLMVLRLLNKLKIVRLIESRGPSEGSSHSHDKTSKNSRNVSNKSDNSSPNQNKTSKNSKNVTKDSDNSSPNHSGMSKHSRNVTYKNSDNSSPNHSDMSEDSRNVTIDSDDSYIIMNNLTLINLFLVWFGPMSERKLTRCLLCVQILGSVLAFMIRYPIAGLFYDQVFLSRRRR